ncbi:Nucleoside-diphosphate-sugar epimerase [Paenibacillus sp. 1_12]|uniref:NAD-dependent epimerase/dehydratase family protein n=1 Tax=Paenibacillus sp. 1_12 TaxID=1566278 RepID=UPI0008F1A428|nr:NAD-dependent epimerase/dehydratase family protein [Paenibacillus sp. 1_12]SFM40424.1 Nucleoside-diphosphate-sugar epimerase [Paenibacillus sp. 1_12]
MKIIIIGGTRFIGPFVVSQLLELGHEVVLFHRGQTTSYDLSGKVRHIIGDREQLINYKDEFKHYLPDVVLDMIPSKRSHADVVMRTFKGIAKRIVAISSGDVYRAYDLMIRNETHPLEPLPLTEDPNLREKLFPYRNSGNMEYDKILVEQIIMGDDDLPGTILRLPAVYGPGDNQHRTFEFLKRMDDNRDFILLSEDFAQFRWTHAYVENVASGIVAAITKDRASGKIYNIGEIETLPRADWIKAIGKGAGWNGKEITVPTLPDQIGFNLLNTKQHLIMDSSRIRTDLDFKEIVPFWEGLKKTIAWERKNKPEKIDLKRFDYEMEDEIYNNIA